MLIFPIKTIISECKKQRVGIGKNRCDRDILLMIAKIKNVSYEDVFFYPEKFSLYEKEKKILNDMLLRYQKNEPLSKIINKKSFWLHDFFVNEHVLDPRPETELIIEAALSLFSVQDPLKILDIGTGSGCILLSLLCEFYEATGIGIDISEKAIAVSEINKKRINIQSAKFLNVSLKDFRNICAEKFEVIVSNPPYIKTDDIDKIDASVKNFDPILALDGGKDGLRAYEEFSPIVRELLSENGVFLLEIGIGQAKNVVRILQKNNFLIVEILEDLNGIERVIIARNGSSKSASAWFKNVDKAY